MTQPEYVAALLSIIVGLGVTDLAQSLRELVRPQRTVHWHWLPLLWAATTFLITIQLWWNAFSSLTGDISTFFLPYLIAFLFLYLTCAFALPDPEWEAPGGTGEDNTTADGSSGEAVPLDLESFYFSASHRRWYFGIFVGFIVASQAGFQMTRALEGYGLHEFMLLTNGVFAGLVGALIPTDRWWIHAPISVICFLFVGWTTINGILGLV